MLNAIVTAPKYDSKNYCDVPYVEAVVTEDIETEEMTVFAVNRSMKDSMLLEINMQGFEGYRVIEHLVMENEDVNAVNTKQNPLKVVPHNKGQHIVEDGKVKATLPKLSWNVIRFKKN